MPTTTSTVIDVKKQLIRKFGDAVPVPVTWAWPGPNTQPECVFLGHHPELRDIRIDATHEIPTIKAARKQRQEEYSVPVTVWVFRPDLTSTDAQTCEERAFELFGDLEDELADDPRIGLTATGLQHATVGEWRSTLFPFQKGWACELVFDVDVAARLT